MNSNNDSSAVFLHVIKGLAVINRHVVQIRRGKFKGSESRPTARHNVDFVIAVGRALVMLLLLFIF